MNDMSGTVASLKYPRTPYAPWSPSTADHRPTTDMSAFVNVPIVITEKIDGSNVMLHQGQVHPRSVTAKPRAPWLAMAKKHAAWRTLAVPHLRIYAEDIYGVHAIRYRPFPENHTCYIFAISDGTDFLSWENVKAVASDIAMATVPVLFEGRARSKDELRRLTKELLDQPSALGDQQEGIVIRTADAFPASEFARHVCKMVHKGHIQPAEEHWSRHWKPCEILPPTAELPELTS